MRVTIKAPPALAYGANEPLPATAATPDVLVAVGNMLKGRIGYVAERLGWSESTLQKKISGRGGHVFSVRDLQLVQHVLGEISPTEFLAAAEGYVCVRVNPHDVTSPVQGLAGVMRALGDLAKAVEEEAGDGGEVSPNGNRRVQYHVTELMGCVNSLSAFVSSRVPVRSEGA